MPQRVSCLLCFRFPDPNKHIGDIVMDLLRRVPGDCLCCEVLPIGRSPVDMEQPNYYYNALPDMFCNFSKLPVIVPNNDMGWYDLIQSSYNAVNVGKYLGSS